MGEILAKEAPLEKDTDASLTKAKEVLAGKKKHVTGGSSDNTASFGRLNDRLTSAEATVKKVKTACKEANRYVKAKQAFVEQEGKIANAEAEIEKIEVFASEEIKLEEKDVTEMDEHMA